MDIVADFRASNSSMFPRATSASLSVSVKPKTINFPQSNSNRIGSASGKRLSNLQQPASQLPSASQLSSSPNTSQLFGAAWQEAQQRPRSYSSSSPSNSSSPVPSAVNGGKDRSASEDLTEYRRDLYPNGLRGGPASRLAGGAGIPLPTLRSTLDHALGNISRPSSSAASGERPGISQPATGGAALPPPSSSLTSYASSPSDPAGLFVQTPHGRKDASTVSSAALFLPVEDAAASAAVARPQSKGGRGSKTPSPVPAHNESHLGAANAAAGHHAAPAEKKKVRFMEPIAHPEPRVKAAAELPVRVPGKVAVMSATGAVREIRPILKTTAPPFASHFGGIATGSLGDPHSFANARRAQVAAAQAYNANVAAHLAQAAQTAQSSAASPIVTTINAINTMNNTLSNKNIAVAAPASANQSASAARGGAVPRPATASAAVHSSSHSAAAAAAVSSREAAMREMLLMDSPTNATALAFNARDSLTAQSAHLLRRTVEQLQLAAAPDDAAAASVAEDVASSAVSSARSQYDDIDPAATRVTAQAPPSLSGGIASGGSAGGAATSSALDDLRSHHLQTQQQLRQQLAAQQSQQSDALFHDRRRPRTAGPGIVTADEPAAAADAALSSASAKQRDRRNSGELQQPLLGTVGLLSASLAATAPTASSTAAAAALAPSPSSAAALFSLPAKAITLGTVSCSAVAPTQFFAQHAVLYLQPAFEAARALTIPYAEMSALTLIGLRFRFKIPARLVSDALGKDPASAAGGSGGGASFVLVEFAPSARVQLVKERVVPLIAEAQASHAHAPQHLQLMAQATSPPAVGRAALL